MDKFERRKARLKELHTEFDDKFDEGDIEIDGKILINSLKEQINIQLKWEKFSAKVQYELDKQKSLAESAYTKAYTKAISDKHKIVSSTDAKNIASSDDDYIDHKKLENKFRRIRNETNSVCQTIESRKYILKDISATVINQCESYII